MLLSASVLPTMESEGSSISDISSVATSSLISASAGVTSVISSVIVVFSRDSSTNDPGSLISVSSIRSETSNCSEASSVMSEGISSWRSEASEDGTSSVFNIDSTSISVSSPPSKAFVSVVGKFSSASDTVSASFISASMSSSFVSFASLLSNETSSKDSIAASSIKSAISEPASIS